MAHAGDAVVLLQMGGPGSLDEVRPFLRNLFADPDLIRLPRPLRPLQGTLAAGVSSLRAPKVRPRYEQIAASPGAASPILAITRAQAEALEARLKVPVHVCMRYSQPRADSVVDGLMMEGARRVLLLPLYPHHSGTTVGSSVRDFARAAATAGLEAELRVAPPWGAHPAYLDSVAHACLEAAGPGVHLLLSSHSLPVSYVRSGDPYHDQVQETVRLLRSRLEPRFAGVHHAYQSAVGPAQWLGPDPQDVLPRLAAAGAQAVALAPLGFVSDHIETLYDLDLRYRRQAEALGMEVRRVPSPNVRLDFLDTLEQLCRGPGHPVEEALRAGGPPPGAAASAGSGTATGGAA